MRGCLTCSISAHREDRAVPSLSAVGEHVLFLTYWLFCIFSEHLLRLTACDEPPYSHFVHVGDFMLRCIAWFGREVTKGTGVLNPPPPRPPHFVFLLENWRVQDLNVTSRALVLDALQQLKLSAHKDRQVFFFFICPNHVYRKLAFIQFLAPPPPHLFCFFVPSKYRSRGCT